MNDLEIKLIQYLRAHPKGASSKILAEHCGVSVNTVRRAFSSLFDTVDEPSFYLESKTSSGYRLVIEDEVKADLFFKELVSRSNNPLFENDSSANYKANYIIRRLLTSDRFISLKQLADELRYSESSVRRDLKVLKDILTQYNLKLSVKKNEGVQITGKEIDKRLCMVGQHKIYVNISKDIQMAEPWFRAAFCIGDQEIRQCRHRIQKTVAESDILSYRVTDYGPVYYYLPLIRTRKKYLSDVELTDMQMKALHRSGMLTEAQRLLALCKDVLVIDEREILIYAVILSAFRSIVRLDQLSQQERKMALKDSAQCLGEVSRRVALFDDLSRDEKNQFACCFYMVINYLCFEIYPDQENFRIFQDINPVAEDMCLACADSIERMFGMKPSYKLLLSFYYFFIRKLEKKKTNPLSLNVMVASTYGIAYSEYVKSVLVQKYGKYIGKAETAEFTDLNDEMLGEYDVLLSDIRSSQVPQGHLSKYLHLELITPGQTRISQFEFFIEDKLTELRNSCIFYHTCPADSVENMVRYIVLDLGGDEELEKS